MIRTISQADILPIIKLTEKFWLESCSQSLFGEFNPRHYQRSLIQLLKSELMVGWASFTSDNEIKSILLACLDVSIWTNITLLKEIMWYTDPAHRGSPSSFKLYKEMEKYAKQNGYAGVVMGRIKGPNNYDKLDQFYIKNNFKSLEDSYIKIL